MCSHYLPCEPQVPTTCHAEGALCNLCVDQNSGGTDQYQQNGTDTEPCEGGTGAPSIQESEDLGQINDVI